MTDVKISALVALTAPVTGDFMIVNDTSEAADADKTKKMDLTYIPILLAAQLSSDVVETAKIKDANVTLAKMAVNSIDSDQYVDGSIDTAHHAALAVTPAKTSFFDGDNIFYGVITSAGAATEVPSGWSSAKTATGKYTITHNLGDTGYMVMLTAIHKFPTLGTKNANTFTLHTFGHDNVSSDMLWYDAAFDFIVIRY